MEIRLHGRGGQGGVTCAKLLAAVYARLGQSVQAFGDYAGERSGAPVRAYTRVSSGPITNRNKVYTPDHLLVLDPTLLGPEVVAGLKPGGTLLLNTTAPVEELGERFPRWRVGAVDATAIARRRGIGTRTVVIVNTTIAGAFVRLLDLPFDVLKDAYQQLGFLSNLDAAREAHDAVRILEPSLTDPADDPPAEVVVAAPAPAPSVVTPLTEHQVGAPPALKTGNWRTQTPEYVHHPAPCNAFCPAGNDVIGFLQALARNGGDLPAAARGLARTNPLAGVCGRVCPAPCMEGCNRAEYDGAVNIRGVERWIADHRPELPVTKETPRERRRVAVVGSGPAGLMAAATLAREGHEVTLLEGEQDLGGVLRTGIPTYRLPRQVLDQEIQSILDLGVTARRGEFLDRERLASLDSEFDGVILATGLQRLRSLDLPGADRDGIEQGIRFLHRVNFQGDVRLSGHVVVLGGGNTAMDCARSALRCGADEVTVVYRRTRQEMPAIAEEVEQAGEEGVRFSFLRAPVGFAGAGKRVAEVQLAVMRLGDPDDTGRRRPEPTEERETLACDHVLLALGQTADTSLLPDGWELDEGRISADGHPRAVFAAGDLATGDGTVAHAIGNGRRAAGRLLRALGEDVEVFERPDRSRAVAITDLRLDHFARTTPGRETHRPAAERRRTFDEVSAGLPHALEAHRCFSCGDCTRCDTCLVYCPEGIIRRNADSYDLDYSFCKGCGICARECPRHALEMVSQ